MIWYKLRGIPTIGQEELAGGLCALGLRVGDHVVVHTALSSFGRVNGGPAALIRALLGILGPRGTLVVPTATWRSCYLRTPDPPIPQGIVPYDPRTTPCDADMGMVPETVRAWPGAIRTPHPLISVTAIGTLAPYLAADHPTDDPLRPYRLLAEQGGRILLLGVNHTRNTSVHAAEFMARLPHLSGPGYALISDRCAPGGTRIEKISHEPDCSLGFAALNERIPKRVHKIGAAPAWLLEGEQLIGETLALLQQNPAALLCDHPQCRTCNRGRAIYGV